MHSQREISFCNGADETLRKVLAHYPPKFAFALERKIERLAACQAPRDSVSAERQLPDGSRYYRLRYKDVRAYFWYEGSTIVISHFVYKKWDKLRDDDHQRVCDNWRSRNGEGQR